MRSGSLPAQSFGEAIFLHEIGSLIERFAHWIRVILLGGSITLAWARGMSRSPQRAARFGALTGAIVGGAVDLVFWIFGETPLPVPGVARSTRRFSICSAGDSVDSLAVWQLREGGEAAQLFV